MNKSTYDNSEKVTAVTSIFTDLKVKEQADEVMWEYYEKSINFLNKINLPEENKTIY